MEVINWSIVKNPINWAIVILMVMIAGVAIELLVSHYKKLSPSTDTQGT